MLLLITKDLPVLGHDLSWLCAINSMGWRIGVGRVEQQAAVFISGIAGFAPSFNAYVAVGMLKMRL